MTEEERLLRESIMGLSAPDVMQNMVNTDQNIMGATQQEGSFTPPVGISGFDPEFYGNVYSPAVSPDIEQPTETTRFINDPVQGLVPDINLPVAQSMNQAASQNTQKESNAFSPSGERAYNTITGLSPVEQTDAFLSGVGQGLKDLFTNPIDSISRGVKTFTDAAANYGVNAPEGTLPSIITDSIYEVTKNVDTNNLLATDARVEKGALDALKFVTGIEVDPLRDQGPSIDKISSVEGPQIQTGETGPPPALGFDSTFVGKDGKTYAIPTEGGLADRFVPTAEQLEQFKERRLTGGTTPASAVATGTTAPQVITPNVNTMQQIAGRPVAQPRASTQQIQQAPLTATQRDTQRAQGRTAGADRVGQLSQADLRDLVQGADKRATEGEKMRALQIQQRYGLGQFGKDKITPYQQAQIDAGARRSDLNEMALQTQIARMNKPKEDQLASVTAMVDRMIADGSLPSAQRSQAIQSMVGFKDGSSTGVRSMTPSNLNQISEQLRPGGILYEQGIRVDPGKIDPRTGAAEIYREKPGFELGAPDRLAVSPDLEAYLLPFARTTRQGKTVGEFEDINMRINQFSGTTAK